MKITSFLSNCLLFGSLGFQVAFAGVIINSDGEWMRYGTTLRSLLSSIPNALPVVVGDVNNIASLFSSPRVDLNSVIYLTDRLIQAIPADQPAYQSLKSSAQELLGKLNNANANMQQNPGSGAAPPPNPLAVPANSIAPSTSLPPAVPSATSSMVMPSLTLAPSSSSATPSPTSTDMMSHSDGMSMTHSPFVPIASDTPSPSPSSTNTDDEERETETPVVASGAQVSLVSADAFFWVLVSGLLPFLL